MRRLRCPNERLAHTEVLPAVPDWPTPNDTVRAELRSTGAGVPADVDYFAYLSRIRDALRNWTPTGGRHRKED